MSSGEPAKPDGELPYGNTASYDTPIAPLSILDLFVWTSASALALSVQGLRSAFQLTPPQWQIFDLTHAVLGGAAMAAAVRLVMRIWRNELPMLRHPGHWLLWNVGIFYALELARTYLVFWLSLGFEEPFVSRHLMALGCWGYLVLIFVSLAISAWALWSAWQRSADRVWVWLFGVQLITSLWQGAVMLIYALTLSNMDDDGWFIASGWFSHFANHVNTIWALLHPTEMTALVGVAMIDRRNHTSRDWLHYAGLIILLLVDSVEALRYTASWFLT